MKSGRGVILEKYRAGIIGLGWMGWLYDVADRSKHPISHGIKDRRWEMPPLRRDLQIERVVYSPTHANAYVRHPKTELIAAADHREERVKAFGKYSGLKALYTDWREMLEKESLDLVSITTTAKPRPEITVAAAESGVKGIFTCRPISETLEGADAMVETCKRKGVVLITGTIDLNHPAFGIAKGLLDKNEIGRVINMISNVAYAQNNIFVYLMGEVDWVLGLSESDERVLENKEFYGSGYVHFKNGAEGLTQAHTKGSMNTTVFGDEGKIEFSRESGFRLWKKIEAPWPEKLVEYPWPPPQYDPYSKALYGIHDLIQCIENGGEPRNSGRRMCHAMELEIGLRESYRKGRVRVDLPLKDRKLGTKYDWYR